MLSNNNGVDLEVNNKILDKIHKYVEIKQYNIK
jgi:hypothetical protein